MRILLNGKDREFPDVSSISDIVLLSAADMAHVIAEHNGALIKRDQWKNTPIKDGDRLELVKLVAGG